MSSTSIETVSRRFALKAPLALAGAALLAQPLGALAASGAQQVTVWKTPSCGCCHEWVAHLRKSGFEVLTHDVEDTAPVRQKFGLDAKFGSCHTGRLGRYVVEGHVPARELRRLLREQPKALGLAVPGMPLGSPGMEMGDARQAYDVLLVRADGSSRIYQSYPAKASTQSPATS